MWSIPGSQDLKVHKTRSVDRARNVGGKNAKQRKDGASERKEREREKSFILSDEEIVNCRRKKKKKLFS